MIKAHKIRLNPTPEQEIYFRKAAGTARFVFNWALAEWKRQKALHPGEQHGVLALKKDFNARKPTEFPWVYEVAKDVAEGAFMDLGRGLMVFPRSGISSENPADDAKLVNILPKWLSCTTKLEIRQATLEKPWAGPEELFRQPTWQAPGEKGWFPSFQVPEKRAAIVSPEQ